MISIYQPTRMGIAADANDGIPQDDGVVLVGGVLEQRQDQNVKLHDLNANDQRSCVCYGQAPANQYDVWTENLLLLPAHLHHLRSL